MVKAGNFQDAKDKLHQLDSPASALLELFQLLTQNTSLPDPQFSGPFVAPHVVATTGSAPYMTGLGGLEQAINAMLLVPNSDKDPTAAAPVIQAAGAAESSVQTIRTGFTPPDIEGQTGTVSEALLMAPIKDIEAMAKTAPKAGQAAANSASGAAFCAQIEPVLKKFPFDPDSPVDATLDEVTKIFQPGTGLFSVFASTKKMLVLIGNTYSVVPGSTDQVNPAFLNYLNAAMSIGSVLAPAGGGPPTLNFSMIEEATPQSASGNARCRWHLPYGRGPGEVLHLEVLADQHHPHHLRQQHHRHRSLVIAPLRLQGKASRTQPPRGTLRDQRAGQRHSLRHPARL